MADSAPLARHAGLALALTAFALVSACTSVQQITYSEASAASEPSAGGSSGTLADTAWRLLEIRSIDGTVDRPRDDARYLLSFDADGTVGIVADCNRGNGTWATEHPSKLRFGAIATTQRMCAPESMSDHFLSTFQRVRGYTLEDGRLLLTAGSEGPSMEFAKDQEIQPPS